MPARPTRQEGTLTKGRGHFQSSSAPAQSTQPIGIHPQTTGIAATTADA